MQAQHAVCLHQQGFVLAALYHNSAIAAAVMQVGDGTTTVVILAGEFLRESKPFVEEGVHPQSLIRSFRQAGQLAVQKVKELSISIEGKSAEEKADMLKKCAMTSLNSKLVKSTCVTLAHF